jgi:hypothetical protein
MSLKDPCLKNLSHADKESDRIFKRQDLVGCLQFTGGVPPKGIWTLVFSPIFLLAGHEVRGFTLPYSHHHDGLCHHKPKAMGSINHRWQPPKLSAKINLLSLSVDYIKYLLQWQKVDCM